MKSVATLVLGGVIGIIIYACAPAFPRAVFTYARHPDFPRTAYLSGKLGVFERSYARSYLVLAYRYLNGPTLSSIEREQVREYWKDRLSGSWDHTATFWLERWEKARLRVPGAPKHAAITGQERYRFDDGTNSFFMNCAEDAYRTAYQTILARGNRFGFRSIAVRSWLDAQDAVFAHCNGQGPFPGTASPTLPAVIRADREYQIAAANLYAERYKDAIAGFRKIATDGSSPWTRMAPYLVVRSLTRKSLKDPRVAAEARESATKILRDPKLAALHGMTRVLLHRVLLHGQEDQFAEKYFHELASDLIGGQQAHSLREELWDYTNLYDRFIGNALHNWKHTEKPANPRIFSRDDLSDWIYTFQAGTDEAGAHARARWRSSRSTAWLIAALSYAHPGLPDIDEILSRAANMDVSNPGYEAAAFYRLSFLVNNGEKQAAHKELDRVLQLPLTKSGRNLFRTLRMRTAADLSDFLRFAARYPVMVTTDWNVGEVPPDQGDPEEWHLIRLLARKDLLDRDSIKILNEQTPMRLLRRAALSDDIPEFARRDVVLSAFTRAVLLDDAEDGMPLAEKLQQIGADHQHFLESYKAAKGEGNRRFAGIFYLLHHPEARPYLASGMGRMGKAEELDDYRDNWWCPVDIGVELDARTNMSTYAGPLPPRGDTQSPQWSSAFLSEEDRQKAATEMLDLARTGPGPDYLIRETMRYAKQYPRDPRVPEALHYALRSQRYGCAGDHTAEVAEAAWRYMWRKYPKNLWTRRSNYEFEPNNVPGPGD